MKAYECSVVSTVSQILYICVAFPYIPYLLGQAEGGSLSR